MNMTVQDAANQLMIRIVGFQNHLNTIPGRVDAICTGPHPDHGLLVLKWHRDGSSWIISYSQSTSDNLADHIVYTPLKDAPLKIKIAAVRLFPKMLEATEKSQLDKVDEINRAIAEYDEFAKGLKR